MRTLEVKAPNIRPRTVRDEIAIRLMAYWRVYRKFPDSYNAVLGLGRTPKNQNRPFSGFGIDGMRYVNGVSI